LAHTRRIRGLEDELDMMRVELQKAEEMRSKLAANQMVHPRAIKDAADALERKLNEEVHNIMEDGKIQYIKSLVDSFNASVKGVRIPTMHP